MKDGPGDKMTEHKPEHTSTLVNAVRTAIAVVAEVEPLTIYLQTDLIQLGLDSLSFTAVLVEIEEALGAEVSASHLDELDRFGDIVTVDDIVRFLTPWAEEALARG